MQRQPERHYSADEYFAVEASSPIKHEYCNGEIFALAGASVAHNDITANLVGALRLSLRGTGCRAFANDLRVLTPGGLYTYPDAVVICGRIELTPVRPDTVTNPVLLAEVLSEATRDYDRGGKFSLYKALPTLREYLLIEQNQVAVDHFQRQDTGAWTVASYDRLPMLMSLVSIPMQLPLT